MTMDDGDLGADLPDEMRAHLTKMATPAHVAQYVTAGLPPDAQWRPAKHLDYINQRFVDAATDDRQRFLQVAASVRHGKQVRTDEPILTTHGWTVVGDLVEGDEVFAPDGSPVKVVAVGPVDRMAPKMRVAFTDGTSVDVHPEHEWTVDYWKRRLTLTTAELASRRLGKADIGQWHYKLPVRHPIVLDDADLPVAPYLLGVWLGDGAASKGSVTLNAADSPHIIRAIAEDGDEPSSWGVHAETGVPWFYFSGLIEHLRAMDLFKNKHVPDRYMLGSVDQRRALLQGLVDTDGHVERRSGRVRYVSHDERLCRDVCALARTLGHRATVYTEVDERPDHDITFATGRVHSIRTAGTRFVASWTPHDGEPQGRLGRKQATRIRKPDRVAIKSITPAADADGVCIQVANDDGLYLVGRDLIPTHNSLLLSCFAPVWFLGMFPDRQVILVSYSEDKAAEWGEMARDIMAEWGPELFGVSVGASSSKTDWKLKNRRGGMRSVGINGALTGSAGNCVIIDDPVKNQEEAGSPAQRKKMREWYDGTLRSRLMQTGLMCLTMARWNEDDLAGSILSDTDPNADQWEVINLPAIAEPMRDERESEDFDPDEWTDQIGRKIGEPLWPEEWPLDTLLRIKATIQQRNPQFWDAQYQQNPSPVEGSMFKVDNWRWSPAVPRSGLRVCRFWDTAASEGKGDWTVGALVGIDAQNLTYVLDLVRFRKDAAGVESEVKATAARDGRSVPIRMEQERAGAGKATISTFSRLLVGYDFDGVKAEGSKEDRARGLSAQQINGNVTIVGSPADEWCKTFVEEARTFPNGKHDDQIDAVVGAFNFLVAGGSTELVSEELLDVPLERMFSGGFGMRR